jgi:hypothetical protein
MARGFKSTVKTRTRKEIKYDGCYEMENGSWNIDDDCRPRWNKDTRLIRSHDYHRADGCYAYTIQKGENLPYGDKVFRTGRFNRLPFSDRFSAEDKKPWFPGRGDPPEPWVLYRLPQLIAAPPGSRIAITEGEKDADSAVAALGLVATCNPCGALKWMGEYSVFLNGHHAVIFEDNDERGRRHARLVAASVGEYALSVKVVSMPYGVKDLTELVARKNSK